MKITMYELLGLVKDGKAPKKIKYDNMLWEYNDIYYMTEDNIIYLDGYCDLSRVLNDEVEIIEEKEMCHKCHKYPAEYNQTYCEFCLGILKLEEKKIPEKVDFDISKFNYKEYELNIMRNNVIANTKAINEIIDCLKHLKSKGDE